MLKLARIRNQMLINDINITDDEYRQHYNEYLEIEEKIDEEVEEEEKIVDKAKSNDNSDMRKFMMKLLGINTRKACDRMKKSIIVDIVDSNDELRGRAGENFEKLTINKICNNILGPVKK